MARKVLIVEDDPAIRAIVAKVIESMGHVPLLSPNGKHALETLACDPDIALILTDMAMPVMDGRELIKEVRRPGQAPAPPVLIMSGVVGPRDIADLLEEGAEAFLTKPIRKEDLREYVARVLGGT